MVSTLFTDHLNAITSIPRELSEQLNYRSAFEELRPKQVWSFDEDQTARLWFVRDGLLHRYYFDNRGDPVSVEFYGPGDLIVLFGAWRGTTKEYLESIQPALISTLNYTAVEPLFPMFPELKMLAIQLLRLDRANASLRTELLHLPALLRYKKLRQIRPQLFREFPLRMLASYLNMTRENLSRLIGKDR